MTLDDLVDMDMGAAVDWLLENKDEYALLKNSQLADKQQELDEALSEAEVYKGVMLEALDCIRKHNETDLAQRLSLLLGWSTDRSETLATLKQRERAAGKKDMLEELYEAAESAIENSGDDRLKVALDDFNEHTGVFDYIHAE